MSDIEDVQAQVRAAMGDYYAHAGENFEQAMNDLISSLVIAHAHCPPDEPYFDALSNLISALSRIQQQHRERINTTDYYIKQLLKDL